MAISILKGKKKTYASKLKSRKRAQKHKCASEIQPDKNLWNKEVNDIFKQANSCNVTDTCDRVEISFKKEIVEQIVGNDPFCDDLLINANQSIDLGIKKTVVDQQKISKKRLRWSIVTRNKYWKRFERIVSQCSKKKKKHKKSLKKKRDKNLDNNAFSDLFDAKIRGRRIIDFNYMWQEMRNNLDNHGKCTLNDWKFERESNFHGGLRTLFCFRCRRCKKECRIWSEPFNESIMGINECSVLGCIAGGFGFSQIEELFATMHIPFMSDKTFKSYQENLLRHLDTISAESMGKANEEESRLAKEANEVDENGIPFITVIVDGSWIKRSFGNKYDSLSGLGAIIGKRTGKVLYVGVKNKYCTRCFRAQSTGQTPTRHDCRKNFPLNSPSTLMESEALIEGFQQSFEKYGLIYKFFIGDGDSNFHKRLVDVNPYRDLKIIPHKIECTNHLLRNLCKKNEAVAKTTQKKGEKTKGFVGLRNVVKNNVLKIRQTVLDEVDKQLAETEKPWESKINDLKKNLLNIPSHIFGEHKRCKSLDLFCCSDAKPNKDKNYVPYLKAHGLYHKLEQHIQYLSSFSESLLHKDTNNIVESFNNIICKLVNGKRVNYAASNQYNTRVAVGVLQHNSQQALTQIYISMGKEVPNIVKELDMLRKSKVARTRSSRAINGRKRKNYCFTDENYGPKCDKLDKTENELHDDREKHFQELRENQANRVQIELNTRKQSESDLWETLRRKLLTASNFGPICRMKPQTSCATTVKSIIFPSLQNNAAMAYGRANEDVARKELEKILRKKIDLCGLFIDPVDPRFAASPDGTIDTDGIVEIKNPYRAMDLTAQQAMQTYSDLNFVDPKTNSMKITHRWYYQIQGQLHVTQRNYCVFALRTPQSIELRVIKRNDNFWQAHMEPYLSQFYDNCLLPEILDSRYLRSMPIRNPSYILEAKEKYEQKRLQTKPKRKVFEQDIEMPLKKEFSDSKKNKKQSLTKKVLKDHVQALEENREKSICQNAIHDYYNNVQIVASSNDINEWTPENISNLRTFFTSKIFEFDENDIEVRLLDIKEKLTDDDLDAFLGIVKEQTNYEIESTNYLYYPAAVEPANTSQSIVILGGSCTDHWRFGYFDGSTLRMYDSIPNFTGGKLVQKELEYVMLRFPSLQANDINFVKIKTIQPDAVNCGVYAAALATHFILKGDPSKVSLSRDVKMMRNHFLKIIKSRKLALFPIEGKQSL